MTSILLVRAGAGNTSPGTLTSAALTSACGPDMAGYLGYTTLVTGLPAALGLLSAAVMFC